MVETETAQFRLAELHNDIDNMTLHDITVFLEYCLQDESSPLHHSDKLCIKQIRELIKGM